MKRYPLIYIYGAIIILEGIFLLFSAYTSFTAVKLSAGLSLMAGAIIAFVAAFSRRKKIVLFAYHELHALAMFVYGVSILVLCDTYEQFVTFSAFLFMFYSFSEIIFCNWLFNFGQKMYFRVIILRFLLGLAIGIGTIVAMIFTSYKVEGFGLLFIVVGVSIVLYVPVMTGMELSDVQR